MAGPDVIRGIAFQHALGIQLALDVLEDPDANTLTIEGAAHVVDVELARRTNPRRPISQIKSRQEPYAWQPSEIADVIRDWQDAGGGRDAPLRFISDGPASPETARRLAPALDRARSGTLTEHDRAYLTEYGIDETAAASVELATRSDSTGGQLAMAENRMRALLALSGPVSGDAPIRAVDRLFRLFAVRGGDQRIERRTFTRGELAAAIGVELAVLDSGAGWSDEIAGQYRAAVAAEPTVHPLVELVALLDPTASTPALTLTVRADDEPDSALPAYTLIDGPQGAGVCGAAGTGKTTSARQMTVHAAGESRTGVLIACPGYRRGDLDRRVRRVLEKMIRRPLAAGAVSAALAEPEATLLVDGLEGLTTEQRDAVAADLRDLQDRLPELRLVLVARERTFPRRFALPTYTLSPLDTEARTAIAEALVDDAAQVVADLEMTFGEVVDNPLLFVMALALTRVGGSAEGRPEIFSGFLGGLRERATGTTVDETDFAVARLCAAALVAEERFAANRYWWLQTAAEALEKLREQGVYDVGDRSAEVVLNRLLVVGLLFDDDIAASVSLLHDEFRDYLSSVALLRGEVELPRPVGVGWESAAELLAEQGGIGPRHARALATDNAVAAMRAARFDRGEVDARLTGELARTIASNHLGQPPFGTDFAVVIVDSATHRYALVVANGEDAEMPLEQAGEVAAGCLCAVALNKNAGPLALAAALWWEFTKRLTSTEPPSLQRRVPDTAAGLADAIAEHFVECRAELEGLAERLVPTLASRVVAAAGWSGLRGYVEDSETVRPFPLGGQELTLHSFHYEYGGETIEVTASPTPRPESEFRSHGIAESFVETPPRDAALETLVDHLKTLLPEIS